MNEWYTQITKVCTHQIAVYAIVNSKCEFVITYTLTFLLIQYAV